MEGFRRESAPAEGEGARSADDGSVWHSYEVLDLRPVQRWFERGAEILGYAVAPEEPSARVETFYDTHDWRFHRAGLVLFVREDGSVLEAVCTPRTIGDTPPSLAVATASIPENKGSALAGCRGRVGERVRALAGPRALGRRLVLDTRRETFSVDRAGNPLVRVHLDRIKVPGEPDESALRFPRVHVVAQEESDELTRFLRAFQLACNLRPTAMSPYQAAVFALGLGPPPATEIGSAAVRADMTTAQVGFAVLREHFAKWLANEAGTRLGEDIEELHDMRVSIRRMRAAIRLFQEYLPVRLVRVRKELGWVGRALGEVRDLDVKFEQLEEWRRTLEIEDRPALGVLFERLAQQRVKARKHMLRALDSRRYERLVERITTMLRRGPGRRPDAGRLPIVATGPVLIERVYRKVRRHSRRMDSSSPPERYHSLRIKCKRLRYAMESAAPVYGPPARRMIREVTGLQDLLGEHQDACVALERLREMVEGRRRLPPATLYVIGRLAERYTRRAKKLRTRSLAAFGGIRGRPWKRLRKVMRSSAPRPLPPPPASRPPPGSGAK